MFLSFFIREWRNQTYNNIGIFSFHPFNSNGFFFKSKSIVDISKVKK